MLFGILVVIFVIVCLCLSLLILIQSDKGGGISGALGGGLGGASNLLGTQDTANILTRLTTIFATIFFTLCIIMSFLMGRQNVTVNKSLLQKRAEKQQNFSPASVLGNSSLPLQGADEASPNPATDAAASTGSDGEKTDALPLPVLPSAGDNTGEKNTQE